MYRIIFNTILKIDLTLLLSPNTVMFSHVTLTIHEASNSGKSANCKRTIVFAFLKNKSFSASIPLHKDEILFKLDINAICLICPVQN